MERRLFLTLATVLVLAQAVQAQPGTRGGLSAYQVEAQPASPLPPAPVADPSAQPDPLWDASCDGVPDRFYADADYLLWWVAGDRAAAGHHQPGRHAAWTRRA